MIMLMLACRFMRALASTHTPQQHHVMAQVAQVSDKAKHVALHRYNTLQKKTANWFGTKATERCSVHQRTICDTILGNQR